jgi:Ni2+-binding GTPase involved in maturation of urease and hydrogenase
MRQRFLILAIATAAALGGATSARAETNDDMSFSGMFKADRLDVNKDNMVSKAEFLAMMDKAYDMKAKEMKAKSMGMTMEQFKAFSAWLSRGEKN